MGIVNWVQSYAHYWVSWKETFMIIVYGDEQRKKTELLLFHRIWLWEILFRSSILKYRMILRDFFCCGKG